MGVPSVNLFIEFFVDPFDVILKAEIHRRLFAFLEEAKNFLFR
jgi:hypothetical protein